MSGNGLFAVDGVNLADLVAEHLGPRMLPAVLIKPGAAGARNANPTGGRAAGDPTQHNCRGFIEDFTPAQVDGDIIKVGDRKVILLAGTIEDGVEPEGGTDQDRVLIEGKNFAVWRVLARDPAAATFTLQVRSG